MADYAIHDTTLTGISNVIRKKDGTSALIDPADYADRINLMGMLEEKTVSGAIAHITDGADEVPIKSWKVEIAPTLTGKSAIEATQTGRNLFNVADYSQIYTDRDGVDSYNYRYMIIQLKPNTTYTVSQNSGEYSGTPIILINNALPVGGANYFDLRKASDTKTYTTDSTGLLYIGSVNSYDDVAYSRLQECNVQIEVGSTATTYEAYTAPTVSTVNLGRTIHGGTADVVNGQGTSTHGKITDFSTLRANGTSSTGAYRYIIDVSGMGDYNVGACVSNLLTYRVSYNADVGEFYNTTNVLIIFLTQDNAQDAITYLQSNSCEIAYPLATTETFTFTPITPTPETALGVNNFWADEVDSEVTYRSMGTVYQYPEGEGVSF
jgi:hypothetical protein